MATPASTLPSSSARALPLRARPDLQARRQRFQGRTRWVVKDPLGLNYFCLRDEEYATLRMLDGRASLDELRRRFEARFAPRKITLDELQGFLGMLHRSGLVVSSAPGQGRRLLARGRARQRKQALAALGNILCVRFRGFDPERLLAWLYPRSRWLFSPPGVAACLALCVASLALVVVQFDVFRARLPDFERFFGVRNALLLAAVLAATKVLHELGHGLACRHFGGECHEIGVMLLVLTPCLYCNVSDSWLLANKWRRAAIGAAGMYVELVLAGVATLVWWWTEPGLLHHLALDVMFISSVSTVVFNGNPLLRYDGYFILSDLLEVPNLRQQATAVLRRKAGQWLLGIEPPEDPFLPRRRQALFALYTVAAVLYRWAVLAAILLFLHRAFEPLGLAVVGQAIAAVSVAGLVGMPLYQVACFFCVPGRTEQVNKPRMCCSLAAAALAVAGALAIPLPHYVVCTLQIQPRGAEAVYVHVPGALEAAPVRPGDRVAKGQTLAVLRNPDVRLHVARLATARDLLRVRLANLQWRQHLDAPAAAEIRETREALRAVEGQLAKRAQDVERLRLVAPADGAVLPPFRTPSKEDPAERLPGWSGTPLDPKNLGCLLDEGTLFCQVGDPRRMEAVLVIDQSDVEMVRAGQIVTIQLDELPGAPLTHNLVDGRAQPLTIAEVASSEIRASPTRLAARAGGELPTKTGAAGVDRPMSPSYQARVPLEDPAAILRPGLRGTAKVRTEGLTLAARAWRLVMQTVKFKL